MKIKSLLLTLIALASFTGISAQTKKESNKETVVLHVPMDCHSCKAKIEKNIAFEKGVKDMSVNMENNTVEITYDKRKTDTGHLQSALKELGYESTVTTPESNKN